MKTLKLLFFAWLIALATTDGIADSKLQTDFRTPPQEAQPWVYWYFMDGNMTREGLTADLEAMEQAGIGGAIFLEVNLGLPQGPVKFMSPEWQELLAHALKEANRLGIEIALGSGPGWCGTGGPWVPPDESMQHLVASQTNVTGPATFDADLERPAPRPPFFGTQTLTPELSKLWRETYSDVAVLAFPKLKGDFRLGDIDEKALYKRAPYSSAPGVKSSLASHAEYPPAPLSSCIMEKQIIDLSSKLNLDGRLKWDVPPGEWTILRFVRTPTGQTTRPAPAPGLGFETDKFSRAALKAHLERFIGTLLKKQPRPRAGANRGLTTLHFDSWEMSSQNWSQRFREEFLQRRGYDPLPYLPAYTGLLVDSPETTERFLWDVRQTAQELVVTNHLLLLSEFAHGHGLKFSNEPYDMNPCADLTLGAAADVPMGEFWWLGFNTFYSIIEAASLAHTGGHSVVGAEAFTSEPGEDWRAYPGNMKSLGDWAFAAGVNRIAFHRYQHQPWLDREPGMGMGPYGVHWERTQTWWPFVGTYHRYLSRCQFLLRQGTAVADILYLAPEGAPHVFRAPPSATIGDPPDRREYNFDACSPETLMSRAKVKNGRIAFSNGTTYEILVLPEVETMTPALLRRIGELVRKGARVIGPPPRKSPSLSGFPYCDDEVKAMTAELWGHPGSKPQVIWRKDFATSEKPASGQQDISIHYASYPIVAGILHDLGVAPDFESSGPIRYTHRKKADTDIYFVANRSNEPIQARCRFRVPRGVPELWHPATGECRTLEQFETTGQQVELPLNFAPAESYFIIFRKEGKPRPNPRPNFSMLRKELDIPGPWTVRFDPKRGGPERKEFSVLKDWTESPEPGIKFYSGIASYGTDFACNIDTASIGKKRVFIDLGKVNNMARVTLNGRDLGVVWCAPWRVDATDALKNGDNHLVIEVANLWINRLIGDAGTPEGKRITWASKNPYKPDSPLSPSGLLGPVTLQQAD